MQTTLATGLSKFFSRRVAITLLWTCVLLSAVILANIIGIHALGSTRAWEQWLMDNRWHLFPWRIVATAYGWQWMRRRVVRQDESSDARARFQRSEVAAVVAVISVEIITLYAER